LQLFQIQNAFLQPVWLVGSDCDIHMEIADTAHKTAPRVIVELRWIPNTARHANN
jgi:hypothetical protein